MDTDYRTLLLQFIGSLTLCDHMGDVSDNVNEVLNRLGLDIEWSEFNQLGSELGKMGVSTLNGTDLREDK